MALPTTLRASDHQWFARPEQAGKKLRKERCTMIGEYDELGHVVDDAIKHMMS